MYCNHFRYTFEVLMHNVSTAGQMTHVKLRIMLIKPFFSGFITIFLNHSVSSVMTKLCIDGSNVDLDDKTHLNKMTSLYCSDSLVSRIYLQPVSFLSDTLITFASFSLCASLTLLNVKNGLNYHIYFSTTFREPF